jgi:hypothetical protein
MFLLRIVLILIITVTKPEVVFVRHFYFWLMMLNTFDRCFIECGEADNVGLAAEILIKRNVLLDL